MADRQKSPKAIAWRDGQFNDRKRPSRFFLLCPHPKCLHFILQDQSRLFIDLSLLTAVEERDFLLAPVSLYLYQFLNTVRISVTMGCIDFFAFQWFLKDGKITAMGMDFLQVIASYALSVFLPMFIFYLFDLVGVDVTYGVYVATLIFLNVMSILILTECFVAYFHKGAPSKPGAPEAPASAIICAYMPNEAETIMETLEHFLSIEYEPGIQIIISYNTPVPMPIEDELRVLSNQHPNLLVLKIENSRSKSQNLNAALDFVVGDFVGVFDADHQPDLDSYSRAWRWLSNGYDVVQGHCLSRNPEETWMAKMVAIEFETIYAVAHPGRTVRDGFGVFGGSNGYWKSPLLKRIGMLGSMLTEDIDSSMRVLAEGGTIGVSK